MATDPHLPSVYPMLRYKDTAAAVEFLTKAFGFGEHQVDRAPDGTIVHAELSWGTGLIMLGPKRSDAAEGGHLDAAYIAVDDPDAHHDQAVAAGGEIIFPLTDQSYGSHDYGARDPEGYTWSFGTYRPAPTEAA